MQKVYQLSNFVQPSQCDHLNLCDISFCHFDIFIPAERRFFDAKLSDGREKRQNKGFIKTLLLFYNG
jgi:hypothetical protein